MDVTVAVFDVDNTLTMRDCVVPFVSKVVGRRRVFLEIVKNIGAVARLTVRRDRDGLKLLFVKKLFSGREMDQVDLAGIQFAAMVSENWIRQDVAARLRWHQSQGHVVLLVSASLSPYLVPFGDLLEVDAVLCATLEQADGVYTGNLVGQNCRGAEKVNRIKSWCQESGVAVESIYYAYGDSDGDTEMLNMATESTWVKKKDIDAVPA